jgi:hypothetical protein
MDGLSFQAIQRNDVTELIFKKRIRKQVSDLKNTKRVSSDLLTREI